MSKLSNTYLGVGIYSVSEAARLTGVSAARIRRWLEGYTYYYGGRKRCSPALWPRQLPKLEGSLALGFLDLMEVRFINAFREYGVSWKTLRLAAQRARQMFAADHPFGTRRFETDGRSIFADVIEETGEWALLDVVKSQYAFRQVLSPYLYKGLEFGGNNVLARWWPLGARRQVVLDPQRSFGQPIVAREGVPTAVLAQAYAAEESIEVVARSYEVKPSSVRDALEYERKLAA